MREYLSDTDRYLKIMKSLENGKIIWGSGLPDRTIARLWKSARTKDIWPFPNVWLGVTAENQKRANERIPVLLDTPAAVRFVSVEPMLGPVNLTRLPAEVAFGSKYRGIYTNALVGGGRETSSPWKLNWVIVGGETGPGARPMHPDWPRSLRDQCVGAGVPFFFKQWGEWSPGEGPPNKTDYVPTDGYLLVGDPALNVQPMVRVGRAKAGRILDGREWNEMPGKDKERSHGHERRF